MDVEAALRVLEDLAAQPEQGNQLSPTIRQRILTLCNDLPGLVLIPERIAFMHIFEASPPPEATQHI